MSGYSQGNEDYPGSSSPTKYDGNMKTEKPTSKENEKEKEQNPTLVQALSKYGLPSNRKITPAQQKDIDSAKSRSRRKKFI